MPMTADSSCEMCTQREGVRRWMEFCPAGQKGSMSVGRGSHTAAMRIDHRGAEKPSQSFELRCRGRGERRTLWKRWVGHWIKTWGFGFDSAWCKCMFRLQGPSLRKATDLYNDRVSVREKKELRRTEAPGALVYLNRRWLLSAINQSFSLERRASMRNILSSKYFGAFEDWAWRWTECPSSNGRKHTSAISGHFQSRGN